MKKLIVKFSPCAVYGKVTAQWLTSALHSHLDKSDGQCRVSLECFTSIFWRVKSLTDLWLFWFQLAALSSPDEITSLLAEFNITPIMAN